MRLSVSRGPAPTGPGTKPPAYNSAFQIKGLAMPIYAYRCASCGPARDVLQKLSDPVLTVCPACGAESFSKQLTAAGFQLKGSGWYVTDFRNNGGGSGGGSSSGTPSTGSSSTPASSSGESGGGSSSGESGGGTSASASASACGGGCACH